MRGTEIRFLQDDALSLLAAVRFLAACGRSFRLDDASHEPEKDLLDVLVCLGARLEERALVLCCQLLSTQRINLSLVLHVGLVSNQEEGNLVRTKTISRPSKNKMKGKRRKSFGSVSIASNNKNKKKKIVQMMMMKERR